MSEHSNNQRGYTGPRCPCYCCTSRSKNPRETTTDAQRRRSSPRDWREKVDTGADSGREPETVQAHWGWPDGHGDTTMESGRHIIAVLERIRQTFVTGLVIMAEERGAACLKQLTTLGSSGSLALGEERRSRPEDEASVCDLLHCPATLPMPGDTRWSHPLVCGHGCLNRES